MNFAAQPQIYSKFYIIFTNESEEVDINSPQTARKTAVIQKKLPLNRNFYYKTFC